MTRRQARALPRTGAAVTFSVLFLLIFAAVLLGLSPSLSPVAVFTGHGFDVDVPRVVGLTQTQALLDLESSSLHGRVRFGYSSTVPRGVVLTQRPSAGRRLRRSSTATLTVSRGPNRVPVPDLAGLTEAEVRRQLRSLGLTSSIERVNDEVVVKGSVVKQSPTPGEVVSGGGKVSVVISLGPVVRTVPDVSGIAVEGALFTLGKAGLTLGVITPADDPKRPEGAVIGTDPPAGTTLDRDSPVNLVVSNGPPPVPVPQLIGGTQANAAAQLATLGLVAGEVSSYTSATAAEGTVLSQSPAAGTPVRPGQVVILTVQRAAPASATTSTVGG